MGYVHAVGQVGVPDVAIEKVRVPSTAGGAVGRCGGSFCIPTLAVASLVSAARPARASLALQRSSCLGVA